MSATEDKGRREAAYEATRNDPAVLRDALPPADLFEAIERLHVKSKYGWCRRDQETWPCAEITALWNVRTPAAPVPVPAERGEHLP